ncbi:SIR2 family protein [Lonsdalea quercina]|uniref:SIR2 family protein n=1 Tax=Lonsdalea quercina TaxID=71657 RepID=UPI0039758DA2
MDELESLQRNIQECMQLIPVVVLGSGASVPHGIPGMGPLGERLARSTLPEHCLGEEHQKGWSEFLELLKSTDLESALTRAILTEDVTRHIVITTWEFLNSADLHVYQQIIINRNLLPLSNLFRFLFRSTAVDIHVVTPNYDRLAEYAAEAAGYSAFTGFSFGYMGERTQNLHPRIVFGGGSRGTRLRTVNIWKVHGSFGWFRRENGTVVALPPMHQAPIGFEPVIVTPGTEKYRRTHDEPFRSAMQNADEATQRATAFLCIGYGFNDTHLQPKLVERCQTQDIPLVLITKSISSTAHQFFRSGRCKRYIAIEEAENGIRYYSSDIPEGTIVQCPSYWKLENFIHLFS